MTRQRHKWRAAFDRVSVTPLHELTSSTTTNGEPDGPFSLSHARRRSTLMQASLGRVTYSIVRLADGVKLSYDIHGPADAALRLVVAHGLGSGNPSSKDHTNDATVPVVMPALEDVHCRAVCYTARGHGRSEGWDPDDSKQFMWPTLASDLTAVADAHQIESVIVRIASRFSTMELPAEPR